MGDVELGQQLSLKTSKRKPKLHFLEKGSVDEAEQLAVVPLIGCADRFTWEAGQHDHFAVMLLVEGKVGLISLPESVIQCLSRRSLLAELGWPKGRAPYSLAEEGRLLRRVVESPG